MESLPQPPAPATCSATCPAAASAASVPGGPWGRGDWGHLRFGNVPRWSCPSPLHARTCMCTHTHRCAQPSRAEDALGVPGVCCSQPRVESGWDSLAATADFIPLFTAKQRTQQRPRPVWPPFSPSSSSPLPFPGQPSGATWMLLTLSNSPSAPSSRQGTPNKYSQHWQTPPPKTGCFLHSAKKHTV